MKIFKISFLLLAFCLMSLSSCKNEASKSELQHPFGDKADLIELLNAYEAAPNTTTANNLLKGISTSAAEKSMDPKVRKSYLLFGLGIAKRQNMPTREPGFLFPLIKDYISDPKTPARIDELAGLMSKMNKPTVANVFRKGLIDNYPDYEKIESVKNGFNEPIDNIDEYIKSLGEKIFLDPDNTGINRNASLSYVDACEAYAAVYQNNPLAPENLFKAAEVAKSIRTFPKSLSIYDWILEKYPNYDKAPTSLFLKGFIIENNLGNNEEAQKIYNTFLEKYPEHDLADDVEFLLENIGKTDEEILEMIEAKRAQ